MQKSVCLVTVAVWVANKDNDNTNFEILGKCRRRKQLENCNNKNNNSNNNVLR